MHKKIITLAAILAGTFGMSAQVQNYALKFGVQGVVNCGQMTDIDNASSYSIQFWVNPDVWTQDAEIINNGNLIVKLGSTGSIQFIAGESTITAKSDNLAVGKWSQVTLINDNGNAKLLIDGVEQATGTLAAISSTDCDFKIGGGTFSGRIDELRVWNVALNSDFNYFINNTVNKWCPQWDGLVAYYKFDQAQCKDVVEYKEIYEDAERQYTNHGSITGDVTRVAVNDNYGLPYLVNAAYTENNRFYDRAIPRDQYLLSNDLIILGADVKATGHAVWRTPCNHATAVGGVKYLSEFDGRTGVASFDGTGYLEAPATTLTPEINSTNNLMSTGYTIETWLYIDEWVEGAYIFKKENADGTKGFSLKLGAEENNQLIATVDGEKYVNIKNLKVGEWMHVGVTVNSNTQTITTFTFVFNGSGKNANKNASDGSTNYTFHDVDDVNAIIGENFKGKFDNFTVWNTKFSASDINSHSTNPLMPGIGKTVTAATMRLGNTFYKFDNPDNFGYSSYSQDEWKAIMLSAYEGYNQPTVRLSINGDTSSGTWMGVVKDAEKRKILAADIAELVKDYDGVELDFEWFYTSSEWAQYGLLADEIKAVLPEGKTFHISCHNVAYGFPTGKISEVDGFTFQQYGPQSTHFNYNTFVSRANDFVNYGYPKDKIVLSYATTTSKGSDGAEVTGVRNGLMDGDDFVPSETIDQATYSGQTYYFCGPIQTYKRAKYCVDNNLQGIFYWDMGNDVAIDHKYNLAKYASYGLNSNIEKVVTEVSTAHGSTSIIDNVVSADNSGKLIITPNPAIDVVRLAASGQQVESVSLYNLSGNLVKSVALNGGVSVNVSDLAQGYYVVVATTATGSTLSAKLLKK